MMCIEKCLTSKNSCDCEVVSVKKFTKNTDITYARLIVMGVKMSVPMLLWNSDVVTAP